MRDFLGWLHHYIDVVNRITDVLATIALGLIFLLTVEAIRHWWKR